MENRNLFILRLLLASVFLTLAVAKKAKETELVHKTKAIENIQKRHDFYSKPKLDSRYLPKNKGQKVTKKPKVSKRDAYNYRRYSNAWSARSSNGYGEYSSNLPLYLVFNRKVGAYYPFYKYPNDVRRSRNRTPPPRVDPVKWD